MTRARIRALLIDPLPLFRGRDITSTCRVSSATSWELRWLLDEPKVRNYLWKFASETLDATRDELAKHHASHGVEWTRARQRGLEEVQGSWMFRHLARRLGR